ERRGAEVRLVQQQGREDRGHEAVGHDPHAELAYALALLRERAGEVEDERDLHRLRRLQAERSEMDPAPRSAPYEPDAGNEYQDEAQHAQAEEGIRHPPEPVR